MSSTDMISQSDLRFDGSELRRVSNSIDSATRPVALEDVSEVPGGSSSS